MRKLIISFVLAGFAIMLSAQDLDKILNDHYKATAQDKISQISSATIKGKVVAMGMETGITMYQARPNKLRMEAEMQGSKLIQTYNGKKGWMFAPAMGIAQPKELTDQELESILGQAEFENPLWNYGERGNLLELVGSSEDGKEDQLKLTRENGDVLNFFLSKNSHLITTITSTQQMGGSEQDIEINMKDYKKVKGIPVAHYIATKIGGQIVYTITIEEVEYNQELDSTLFEKPVVE